MQLEDFLSKRRPVYILVYKDELQSLILYATTYERMGKDAWLHYFLKLHPCSAKELREKFVKAYGSPVDGLYEYNQVLATCNYQDDLKDGTTLVLVKTYLDEDQIAPF